MKIWGYVMLAVTAIGGFLTFMFSMKKAGRDAAENEAKEKVLEAREKMDAVPDSSSDDTVDSLRDDKF